MSKYELREVGRDEDSVIKYDLICDGAMIWKSIPYRVAMDHLYSFINEGDTFQEFYLSSNHSELLTYTQIQNSLGKKAFEKRRRERGP